MLRKKSYQINILNIKYSDNEQNKATISYIKNRFVHDKKTRGYTRLADMLPSENEDNALQIKEKSTEITTPFFCARSYCTFRRRYFGYPSQFGSPVLPQNPYGHQPSFDLGCRWSFDGSVELDESYFGGRRKGRRGRGAAGKVVVFGILKRNGRVYTVVVDNAKSESLLPVIKKKIMPDSIVYTDSLSSYDKLDVSGFIHHRINHCKVFAERQKLLTALTANLSRCFWKNANFGLTSVHRPRSLESCGIGVQFRANLVQPQTYSWCLAL